MFAIVLALHLRIRHYLIFILAVVLSIHLNITYYMIFIPRGYCERLRPIVRPSCHLFLNLWAEFN